MFHCNSLTKCEESLVINHDAHINLSRHFPTGMHMPVNYVFFVWKQAPAKSNYWSSSSPFKPQEHFPCMDNSPLSQPQMDQWYPKGPETHQPSIHVIISGSLKKVSLRCNVYVIIRDVHIYIILVYIINNYLSYPMYSCILSTSMLSYMIYVIGSFWWGNCSISAPWLLSLSRSRTRWASKMAGIVQTSSDEDLW